MCIWPDSLPLNQSVINLKHKNSLIIACLRGLLHEKANFKTPKMHEKANFKTVNLHEKANIGDFASCFLPTDKKAILFLPWPSLLEYWIL